jgi:hypothetical protein
MLRSLRAALLSATSCSRSRLTTVPVTTHNLIPMALTPSHHDRSTLTTFSVRYVHDSQTVPKQQQWRRRWQQYQQNDEHPSVSHWILFAFAAAPLAASTFISLSSCAPSSPPPDYSVFEIHDPPPPPPPTPLMSDRLLVPPKPHQSSCPHSHFSMRSVVIAASAAAPAVVGITTPPPYNAAGSGFIVHPSGKSCSHCQHQH